MKKASSLLLLIALAGVAVASYFIFFRKKIATSEITQVVHKGNFDVVIVTTGELRSKSNVKITAPSQLREVGIYQIKIADWWLKALP